MPSGSDGADAPVLACIALGANLGDRAATLRAAIDRIARLDGIELVARSAFYDTAPVGPPGQPRYLNAAIVVRTARTARDLLALLLSVERDLGRERDGTRWSARTIDLDVILHGRTVIREGGPHGVEVPHPRFRERAFVLVPLAEIAPDALDPVTGERVECLLRACPGRADVVRTDA
ncbi:MAG: hypothetical protein RIS86_2070 [Planctomycetota bacterium]